MGAAHYKEIAMKVLPDDLKEAGDKIINQLHKIENTGSLTKLLLSSLLTISCVFTSLIINLYVVGYDENSTVSLKTVMIFTIVTIPFAIVIFLLLPGWIDRAFKSLKKEREHQFFILINSDPSIKRAWSMIVWEDTCSECKHRDEC